MVNTFHVGAIVYAIVMIAMAMHHVSFYQANVYEADQAKADILTAATIVDIPTKIDRINMSVTKLDNYHGSPDIYPVSSTDYDVMKSNLLTTITELQRIDRTNDEIALQNAISNVDGDLTSIAANLASANTALGFNPNNNPTGFVLLGMFGGLFPTMIGINELINNLKYRKNVIER